MYFGGKTGFRSRGVSRVGETGKVVLSLAKFCRFGIFGSCCKGFVVWYEWRVCPVGSSRRSCWYLVWFGFGVVWVLWDHARGCVPNVVFVMDKRSAGQDLRVWVKTRKGFVIVEIVSAAQVDWRCNRRHSRMLRPITVRPDAVRPPSSRRVVSIRWKWCIWA
jgi:hypothetical protein